MRRAGKAPAEADVIISGDTMVVNTAQVLCKDSHLNMLFTFAGIKEAKRSVCTAKSSTELHVQYCLTCMVKQHDQQCMHRIIGKRSSHVFAE